ncbi:MAG: thymidylate synthase [Nanoarchaeota archaeon]|nr:thymidylate synthase [Nanoarchaeota archaeon]
MEEYHTLLKEILGRGDVNYEPRTQEFILGISGFSTEFDLREGFPLLTTKNVPPRLPFEELFWKLRGERNVKSLVDKNIHIWTANAFDRYLNNQGLKDKIPKHSLEWNNEFEKYSLKIKEDEEFAKVAGDLGPVYGYNWVYDEDKNGNIINQLENLLKGTKEKPGSRYHVLSSWNVSKLKEMALGPCPFWHQFSIWGDFMDLHMVQRSNDIFLGDPFNQAQDSLMLHMVAKEAGKIPRKFIYTTINTHSYLGVPPRSNFWTNSENVKEFQKKFKSIEKREDYLGLREWYLNKAPIESEGNERKDHVPFILEQLSKEPRELPTFKFEKDLPLLEAIKLPALEVVSVNNYNPHKWDSKANMAA